jgi:NAD-dependent DNA ligase
MAQQLLYGLHFCITGEFAEDRSVITQMLMSMGGTPTTSVTQRTNCLIVGQDPGEVKMRRAKAQGIRIVGRDWLANTLRKGVTGADGKPYELRPIPKIEDV